MQYITAGLLDFTSYRSRCSWNNKYSSDKVVL